MKLENWIRNLLSENNLPRLQVENAIHDQTGVALDKIQFRIDKLITKGKLFLSQDDLLGLSDFDNKSDIDYDRFEYGPISIERRGREILITSQWDETEHKQFLKQFKTSLPQREQDLNDLITKIENLIIKNLNPLDAMAFITIWYLFANPEVYSESNFECLQIIVETVQNIILRSSYDTYKSSTDFSKYQELLDAVISLKMTLSSYLQSLTINKDDLDQIGKDIYFKTLSRFLYVRGDAFPQHFELITRELFNNMAPEINSKGFTIDDYYQTIKEIEKQINENYNNKKISIDQEMEKIMLKSMKELSDVSAEGREEEFLAETTEERAKIGEEYFDLQNSNLTSSLFKITINERINTTLLDLLSLEFGSTNQWSTPFDMSEIFLKPVIKNNGNYYCFLIPHLFRNSIQILEWMLDDNEKKKYTKEKGDYFEAKSLDLISQLVKPEEKYNELYYANPNGNGHAELDGLIRSKDTIILIEVKGKKRRTVANRWQNIDVTKKDVEEQLQHPFKQSRRALKYIEQTASPSFRLKDKSIIPIDKSKISSYFLINVTMDAFHEFTGRLAELKAWDSNFFAGDQIPWSVSIYDLYVIADILDDRDDFLNYIEQRTNLLKYTYLDAYDELDFFGYYIEKGSLKFKKPTKATLHGYTEKMDAYYLYQEGKRSKVDKPRMNKKKRRK